MTTPATETTDTVGVVVMAYGTPASPADVEAYYTHIRRGSVPTPEQLADLTRRYDAIGGVSPLAERTEAQRRVLQAALDERAPGTTRVVLGQKHAFPEQVQKAAPVTQPPDRFLEAGDPPPPHPEYFEELVVKGLRLAPLIGGIGPFLCKSRRPCPDLVRAKQFRPESS